MTRQLDDIELRLRMILTEERRRVRGRHSAQATAELNTSIPRLEREFQAKVQAGILPEVNDFFPVEP